uniref:PadR family transcriptional regulator n=2 Tax=Cohnella candidum TaxID=2674991 RepID=A0A3G3JY67_9BACL|nr:PadR family transcriptional regulator [Cohnella candidum]
MEHLPIFSEVVRRVTSMDVILGLLHQRPYTGYEIKHAFQHQFSYFFDASFGTIYPTLGKMEKLGYITKESIPQDNRPVKHLYSLTDEGRKQFREYLVSPLEPESFRCDFLVRLTFGEHLGTDALIRLVEENLNGSRAYLAELEGKWTKFCDRMSPSQEIAIRIGIESNKARVKVLEEGLAKLKGKGL